MKIEVSSWNLPINVTLCQQNHVRFAFRTDRVRASLFVSRVLRACSTKFMEFACRYGDSVPPSYLDSNDKQAPPIVC